jgi:hypothetical protein
MDSADMGRKGGTARAKAMTKEERIESARKAVQARWAKAKKKAGTKTVAKGQGSRGEMKDKTEAYVMARFGILPDDGNLTRDQKIRQAKAVAGLADAMEPFAASLPDIDVSQFAALAMAGVTAEQFAIICEARRAAWLTAPQWRAVLEVFAEHKLGRAKAAEV